MAFLHGNLGSFGRGGGDGSPGGVEYVPPLLLHTFTWTNDLSTLTRTDSRFNDYAYLIVEGHAGQSNSAQMWFRNSLKVSEIDADFRIPAYHAGGSDHGYQDSLSLTLSNSGVLVVGIGSADNDTGVMRIWGSNFP